MKRVMLHFALCLLLGGMLVVPVNADAFVPGLETEAISEETEQMIIDNSDLVILSQKKLDHSIACFAVSDGGQIAVGFDTTTMKTVYVFDCEGAFLYGFEFRESGDFGLLFVEENLAIYSVRGDRIELISPSGEWLFVRRVPRTEANNMITKELTSPVQIVAGDITYTLERDIGLVARSYSRLVATDQQGNTTTIYDITLQHNITTVFVIILLSFLVLCCIRGIVRQIKQNGFPWY